MTHSNRLQWTIEKHAFWRATNNVTGCILFSSQRAILNSKINIHDNAYGDWINKLILIGA